MRFLRSKPAEPTNPSEFWGWWTGARERLAQAIDTGSPGPGLASEISAHVKKMHPEMAWELAPGRVAKHAFCMSPEGRPDLRVLALRWLQAAPPADEMWEFYASRQAAQQLSRLEIGGASVELTEMRAIASWNSPSKRVDVSLWHPAFAQLPEAARLQVAFLFLDNLLGEDDVERWIGKVELLDAPIGGRTPDELRSEVDRHRGEPVADDSWVLGQLRGPDGPTIVLANAALKRIDYPFAGVHVAVGVVLPDGGLPDDAEAARLNAEEDELVRRFEEFGAYAGRTTRPGMRTMHFVAPSVDDAKRAIDAWANDLPDSRRIKVGLAEDVNWQFRQLDLGIG